MGNTLNHAQCVQLVREIDENGPASLPSFSAVRQALEDARVAGGITLHQWRTLLEELSVLQARLAKSNADAWRTPTVCFEEQDFTPVRRTAAGANDGHT